MRKVPSGIYRISSVLDGTLTDMGLFPRAKKYQVFSVWSKAVGDVARYASPRRIADDVLFVSTASSAWSQELTFMRREILRRLNGALGGEYVRDIRFSEHLWSPPPKDPAPFDPPSGRDTGLQVSFGSADDRLKEVATRFAVAAHRRRLFLLGSGYKSCEKCGCLFPSKEAECPYCRARSESLCLRRAMAILEEAPHLGDEELISLLGLSDSLMAKRARDYLDSRYEGVLRALLAEDNQERFGYAEEVAKRLTAMRIGKPIDEVSDQDMLEALGKRHASMLKRGRQHFVGGSRGG